MTNTYIALLRGINVGGHNKLPMKELAAMFEDQGCQAVRTYIQSGNVVYQAQQDLAGQLEQAILSHFGLEVPVITRNAADWQRVIADNPFLKAGANPDTLHVGFLVTEPTDASTLDPNRSPPDSFAVVGREIYLHCPNGLGKTKLTNQWFDSRLKTVSTVRNWRTVLKLLELATPVP